MPSTLENLAASIRNRRALPPPETCRALRVGAGASLEDVAKVVGVTRMSVKNWEGGSCRPRGEHLARYLDVLRVFREADE